MNLEELARKEGARARGEAATSRVTAVKVVQAASRRRRMRAVASAAAVVVAVSWMGPRLLQPTARVELAPGASATSPDAVDSTDSQAQTMSCPSMKRTASAEAAPTPEWSPMPLPPILGATEYAAAWLDAAGLVVVPDSGATNTAVWDVETAKWSCLPAPPLTGEVLAASSPSSVFAWDGSRAAVLEPHAADWDVLPEAPGGSGQPLAAVWAGDRLLVWHAAARGERTPGAMWLPAQREWRRLPPAPIDPNSATAVWGGGRAYLIGSWLGSGNDATTDDAQGAVYDPASDVWQRLPTTGLSPQASSAGWVDGRLLAWDYLLSARTFDPDAGAWEEIPPLPLAPGECYPRTAVVGSQLAAWYCGQLALWNSSSGWTAVPVPGKGGDTVIGKPVAGQGSLFIVSVNTINYGASSWRFEIGSYDGQ